MVAFKHGLAWVIAAALIAGAGIGLLSPALTVVVQNSVPVARMGSATTSQQFIRQIGAALGVSAFVLAATVGGFRLGLLLMIAVSAGTFACVLALPAHRSPRTANRCLRIIGATDRNQLCNSNQAGFRWASGSFSFASSTAGPWTSMRIKSAIASACASIAPTFSKCASSASALT